MPLCKQGIRSGISTKHYNQIIMLQNIFSAFTLSVVMLLTSFPGCFQDTEVKPEATIEESNSTTESLQSFDVLISSHKHQFAGGVYHLGNAYHESIKISYEVTPNRNNIDGVMGWAADAPIDAYQDFSAIVRMHQGGYFDVIDGDNYRYDQRIQYSGNTTYKIDMKINIPNQTYSVWVNGGLIAQDYQFRFTAVSAVNIAQLGLIAGFVGDEFVVSNLNITEENVSEVLLSKTGFTRGIYELGQSYSGAVEITYEALARQSNIDGVMGWAASDATITGYNGFFALVRMNDSGFIDARKGDRYEADMQKQYVPGEYYSFKIIANTSTGYYDVWIDGQQIADNYPFRTDAVSDKNFAKFGLVSSDLDDVLEVKNLNIKEIDGEPEPGRDEFGIEKIYPDKVAGGEYWAISDGFENQNRIKISGEVNKTGSTWIGTPNSKNTFRVAVYVKEGIDDDVTLQRGADHALLAREGYMQETHDWKNVEITGYFRISDVENSGEEITLYSRTGNHRSGSTAEKCQGTAYKIGIEFNGDPDLAKEMHHPGGYVDPPSLDQHLTVGSIEDRWIGVKSIMYNVYNSDGTVNHVKMEMYVDTTPEDKNDPWTLFYEAVDSGNWDGEQFVVDNCKAQSAREMITWGGPASTFRIDDAGTVEFKELSVREIEPPIGVL